MIEADDAAKVADALGRNLAGVAINKSNFEKLPDTFWGYYARGHDGKGAFAVIVTYSEKAQDVDELVKMYEQWVAKAKSPVR
ncbi:MAG: hypothetical protein ACREAY_08215 [Nitrososphaera sp.]|uniref:hypothetical protein n=1 Tax=Nitrososphaera sp. TaxID=1971748 RepID=UPI003D7007FA